MEGAMRSTGVLAIPLLLLAVLVVVAGAQVPDEPGLPVGVQTRLEQYLDFWYAPGAASAVSVERAKRPWNLTGEMSHAVFGYSMYFASDYGPAWPSGNEPTRLPYPPKEVWCALVEGASLDADPEGSDVGTTYEVLFVGLHMTMYNADWMVHKGMPLGPASQFSLSDVELQETLRAIGCELGLTQMGPMAPE
jgi:hypothetical protein